MPLPRLTPLPCLSWYVWCVCWWLGWGFTCRAAEQGLFGARREEASPLSPLSLGVWWERVCVLGDVMNWSLDDIGDRLGRGTFRHFSALELCNVLQALFEDSSKLQNILKAVRHA